MPCMPARGRGMRFQTPKKRCRRNHTRAQVLVAKTFPRRSQTSIAEVLEDFCHEDNWVKADWPPPTTTAACKVVRDCARRHSSQTRSQKGRQLIRLRVAATHLPACGSDWKDTIRRSVPCVGWYVGLYAKQSCHMESCMLCVATAVHTTALTGCKSRWGPARGLRWDVLVAVHERVGRDSRGGALE